MGSLLNRVASLACPLGLAWALAAQVACDDGAPMVGAGRDAGPPGAGGGPPGLRIDGAECATAVLTPDTPATLVITPAQGGQALQVQATGPLRVDGQARVAIPARFGRSRVALTCAGYGTGALQVDGGAEAARLAALCVRPSRFDVACAAAAPTPEGPPVLRLTGVPPRLTLGQSVTLRAELRFADGLPPDGDAALTLEAQVTGGAVTVAPAATRLLRGVGDATAVVRATAGPGTVLLAAEASLDGEAVAASLGPLPIDPPAADDVQLTCTPDGPIAAFDAEGGLVGLTGPAPRCVVTATGPAGPPPPGTRAWILTEAGRRVPVVRQLDEAGQASVRLAPTDRPPVDLAPPGPSPADGWVTVVAAVEGAEPFEDRDGDGAYSEGIDGFDPVTDQGEPFVDRDDDGRRGPDELFFDTDGDGAWTPANGRWDPYTLRWTATRVRWVGPRRRDALRLDCAPPTCSRTPVPGWHDGCGPGLDGYLRPPARALTGTLWLGDRNGQCTQPGGVARLTVTPPEAATVWPEAATLGPCGVGGLPPTPAKLTPAPGASGPFQVQVRGDDGEVQTLWLCAPTL